MAVTPLFSLAAATLLALGGDAFVVLPPASQSGSRGGSLDTSTCKPLQAAAPSADTIQERKDARAALLDSGGLDKLMGMLEKLRKDSGAESGEYEGGDDAAPGPVAAAPAAAAPARKVFIRVCELHNLQRESAVASLLSYCRGRWT